MFCALNFVKKKMLSYFVYGCVYFVLMICRLEEYNDVMHPVVIFDMLQLIYSAYLFSVPQVVSLTC